MGETLKQKKPVDLLLIQKQTAILHYLLVAKRHQFREVGNYRDLILFRNLDGRFPRWISHPLGKGEKKRQYQNEHGCSVGRLSG